MLSPNDKLFITKLLLGLGISFFGLGIGVFFYELAPRRWPQVNGTIIGSDIIFEGGTKAAQYTPVIEYEYSHDGKSFKSTRRRAGNYATGEKIQAEEAVDRYPVGSGVIVFVNPKNPGYSALEYGITALSLAPLFFGILFTTFAMLVK